MKTLRKIAALFVFLAAIGLPAVFVPSSHAVTLEEYNAQVAAAQAEVTAAQAAVNTAQLNYDTQLISDGSTVTTGITAKVYNNTMSRNPNEENLCTTTTLSQIAANWGSGSILGCNSDRVTIHYFGTLTVPDTGAYRFRNIADDGFYLTINGQVVIDEWRDKGCNGSWGAPITLTAGTAYSIDGWYYENGGGACSTLYVSQPSGNWQVTPASWFGTPSGQMIKDPALLAILQTAQQRLANAQAALAAIPAYVPPINPPTSLIGQVDSGTVTLSWTPPSDGTLPERYAIFFSNGTSAGWGVATGNVGDANALNTTITLSQDVFAGSGGLDSTYTFSIRSDNDTLHMYSTQSNTLTLLVPNMARIASEQAAAAAAEAARIAAEQAAAAEAARVAAEQAAAAAAEAARVAAEQAAVVEAARQAEAERVAAIARQEELNRQAAIAAELARQSEVARQAELARQAAAAEQARQAEIAKQAAEAEAARVAAEKAAAEESARVAAEAAAKAEAERIAAEKAAAEQAARDKAAAEAAAKAEAERIAAEAAKAKAEAEAKAAEEAAAKAAAEKAAAEAAAAKAEEDRLAAEAAAKAQAEADAKAEADRLAAEKIAAEQAAKDKAAAEAAAKAEADRIAAEDAAKAKAAADKAAADKAAADKAAADKAAADKAAADKAAADKAAADKAAADKAAADKAAADKAAADAIGVTLNNPSQLSDTVVKEAPKEILVPHVQEDKSGVENGGIEFFGTKSAPQIVGEDGQLTPPAPPPGSGLPIPPEAITTSDTFIGQPGGTTFNAPDIAVPVILVPLEGAIAAVPGAEALNHAFVAMANIGNDMSPVTRKKAKKILVITVAVAAIRRRFK